jgi:hypothetical protein
MSEQVLGKTEVMYITGKFSVVIRYDKKILFFTSKRLILAKLSEDWTPYVPGGFWIRRDQESKTREALWQSSILPEDILKKDAANFAISYSDIEKVEVKKPGIMSLGIFKVITNERTHNLGVRNNTFDDLMKLMRSTLADKLSH